MRMWSFEEWPVVCGAAFAADVRESSSGTTRLPEAEAVESAVPS